MWPLIIAFFIQLGLLYEYYTILYSTLSMQVGLGLSLSGCLAMIAIARCMAKDVGIQKLNIEILFGRTQFGEILFNFFHVPLQDIDSYLH